MKSAGKARSNGLYRHIRTSKEIIRNLLNDSDNYSGDKCAIYEINETGMFIWNNIDGTRSTEELATLLKAAIIDDVDYQILHDDVKEFIDTLIIRQFVEV